ncbi:Spatacsin [Larimichthys crocea]|uniref:Uncharacterized protein n=1 Tax=Larimichthys crocea TaxID=215358 RepID=A0ACD3QFG3_LARCR|nr:Spatacsin [Larimichthys crocea]
MEGLRQVFCCLQRRDLQTANTLLTNMVEELSGRSYFPEDEMQSVAFIKQMEELGSLPAARCPAKTPSQSVVQMVHQEAGCGGDEVLEDLLGPKRSEEDGVLWRNLRLDWVRNWDQSCQTAVLLSRLQHTDLTSCDSAVLWRYLTALHDQRRVVDWIDWNGETSGASRWPELTPELVNNNTVCSTYMRENILDLLASLKKNIKSLTETNAVDGSLQGVHQRRLYKELMRNYNPLERPVNNDSHSLTVHFSFSLLQIMDVENGTAPCPQQVTAGVHTAPHVGEYSVKLPWLDIRPLILHECRPNSASNPAE